MSEEDRLKELEYIKTLREKVFALRQALGKFGEHKYDCHHNLGHDCSCGLEEAKRI